MAYRIKVQVRYAETDRMGIAYHANYFIWFEMARTAFTKAQLGVTYGQIEQLGIVSPVLGVQAKYLAPCTYEDELEVECRLVRATPSQMEFCYAVYKNGGDAPITTGESRHAWVDGASFRPISLKRVQPALYQKVRAAVEPLG